MKKLALIAAIAFTSLLTIQQPAFAQAQITPAQIEQFKKLPRAQQELLARQYGFDLSMLDSSAESAQQPEQDARQLIYPRGTQFDEQGNPLPPTQIKDIFTQAEEMKPFGYSLFAGTPVSFDASSYAPVPDDYRIGPGDTLIVNFFGKEAERFEATVERSGDILIADFPPLSVSGLTFSQVQQLIDDEVKQRKIGVQASVSMGNLRTMQIYLTGEAFKPGTYRVSALTTAFQALFLGGGVSDIASLRAIEVKRNGNTISTIDLYDFLIEGDASGDVRLRSGDVVFIPARKNLVEIAGEVLRPGRYELKSEQSLAEVLQLAGGVLPSGFAETIHIERKAGAAKEMVTVSLGEQNSFVVQSGDKIQVKPIATRVQNSVMLVGAAARPGYYQYKEGMQLSDILTSAHQDALPITDTQFALIVRENDANTNFTVMQFAPEDVFEQGADANINLKPQDTIVLFSQFQYADEERLQLERFLTSENELLQQEREHLVQVYQQNFLRNLARQEQAAGKATARLQTTDINQQIKEIYTKLGAFNQAQLQQLNEQAQQEWSKYSRRVLLAPIFNRMLNATNSNSSSQGIVFVTGEVRFPGVYPRVQGHNVEKAIRAAGGLTEAAYKERVEVTRQDFTSGAANTQTLAFKLTENASTETILQNRDTVNVLRIPDWGSNVQVTLAGEVRFPGTYTVRRGETLSAVIARAGGLTEYAFARGAVFTREELKRLEQERMRQLAQDLRREVSSNLVSDTVSTVSYNEFNQLVNDLIDVEPVGRLVIDLPRILTGSLDADVQLEDGDRLIIPSRRDSINVIGEVQLASSHMFDGGLSVDDYIRRAGGLRQKADEKRIFVVKANGAVEVVARSSWFSFEQTNRLEPGDTIVVPLDTTYKDNWTLWRDATQILYQTGVAIAAVATL